jgi:hypothetical protein
VESELAALKASLPGEKAQGELPPPGKEGPREDRP